MGRLENVRVVHEPFTDAYYFGERRRSGRYGVAPKHEQIDPATYSRMEALPAGSTFIKELAFQGLPYITDEILACCTQSFLIRHPQKVVSSLLPLKPDFTEEELGYTSLEYLLLRTLNCTGARAVVMDGDELRSDPPHVLGRYCKAVGFEFTPSMLEWAPAPLRAWKEHEKESQHKWHRTLETSSGFIPAGQAARASDRIDDKLTTQQLAYVDRAVGIYERIAERYGFL